MVPGGMNERPVTGYDDMVDLSRGYVSPEFDTNGNVRIGVMAADGSMLGNLYLTLIEFSKVMQVVKDQAEERYGADHPDLPW